MRNISDLYATTKMGFGKERHDGEELLEGKFWQIPGMEE